MPFLGAATLTQVIDRLYPRAGERPPASGDAILGAIAATARPEDPAPWRAPAGPSLAGLSLPAAAARLGGTLASALAYLHGKGLAHGDVKPSNVLLQAGGQPMLLDFNLSHAAAKSRIGGTFPYMSFEHLEAFRERRAMPPDQRAASDVYSLGVILYELLTGELPHGAPGAGDAQACAEAMLLRQRTPPRPVRQLNPGVPKRLAALVERCLSARYAQRPSAAEVASALTEVPRRPRRLVVAGLALLVVASLGAAGATLLGEPTEAQWREKARERLSEGRRRLAEGRSEEAHNALHEADAAFAAAIDARKRKGAKFGAWGDYVGRGKAQLSLEDPAEARGHFLQAHEAYREENGTEESHGPTLAYVSYCSSGARDHANAVRYGRLALGAEGRRTPAALNNLAYALLQRPRQEGQGKGPLDEAKALLDEALGIDPNCLAAYRNRAMLARKLHKGRPLPAQAREDVDRAIALSPEVGGGGSGELFRLAAQVYALAAQDEADPARQREFRLQARGHAVRACKLGVGRAALEQDAALKDHLGDCLADVKPEDVANQGPSLWAYLVEPVADP
jgi:tetratricopeptide (TPR) repeat protein